MIKSSQIDYDSCTKENDPTACTKCDSSELRELINTECKCIYG